MTLNLTKVAMGCSSAAALRLRIAGRAAGGLMRVTTRYRPTRHAELIGGSLYWIVRHMLVARQQIHGFEEAEDRRCVIILDADLVPVLGMPRRAHQGWRYLPAADAPADLAGGNGLAELPPALMQELSALALL